MIDFTAQHTQTRVYPTRYYYTTAHAPIHKESPDKLPTTNAINAYRYTPSEGINSLINIGWTPNVGTPWISQRLPWSPTIFYIRLYTRDFRDCQTSVQRFPLVIYRDPCTVLTIETKTIITSGFPKLSPVFVWKFQNRFTPFWNTFVWKRRVLSNSFFLVIPNPHK